VGVAGGCQEEKGHLASAMRFWAICAPWRGILGGWGDLNSVFLEMRTPVFGVFPNRTGQKSRRVSQPPLRNFGEGLLAGILGWDSGR